MEVNIEKEYKVLLSKEQYEKLLSDLNPQDVTVQTNYYFDTPDFLLFDRHIVARIREINESYVFTCKIALDKNEVKEISLVMEDPDIYESDEIKEFFQPFSICVDDLELKSSLTTIRNIVNDGYGEICLDKNLYEDQIDYELEYEMIQETPDFFLRFLSILKKAEVEYIPAPAKTVRCFSLLRTDS